MAEVSLQIQNTCLNRFFSWFIILCALQAVLQIQFLNFDCRELEQQIAELIQAGQIQARIDSDSQVLHKRRTNTRSTVFAEALQACEFPIS